MKRKVYYLLAAAVLLGLVTLAETEEGAQPNQPRIFDSQIIISLAERTMEVSFRYEEVAGNIDDAKKMIIIGVTPASGGINFSFIPVVADGSRERKRDEITLDVITQGRASYYAEIPQTLVIDDLDEIAIVAIAVIDGRGRKAEAVFIDRQIEEEQEEPREIEI